MSHAAHLVGRQVYPSKRTRQPTVDASESGQKRPFPLNAYAVTDEAIKGGRNARAAKRAANPLRQNEPHSIAPWPRRS